MPQRSDCGAILQRIYSRLDRGFERQPQQCLFGSEEALLSYLSTVFADERAMLFSNSSLDESFLEAFLSLGKPWQVMDHEQHLGALLRDLPADSYKTEGVAESLERWHADNEAATKEAEDNAKGRLSAFQEVRQAGARLLANKYDAEPGLFLDSEDVALRCGAYEELRKLDEAEIKAAVERDGDLARVHLVRNERLWRKQKSRDLLLDVVLMEAENDEARWEFNRLDSHYRQAHPTWFEGEKYIEPDERLISESSISDLVAGITCDPAMTSLRERLASVERSQQTLIWMVVVALVMLALHAWR